MIRGRRGLLALALAAALPASAGPAVVIYRCVAADGAVTLQNGTPCAKGLRQQRRVVATPAPVAPSPPAVTPVVALPAPAVDNAPSPPPTAAPGDGPLKPPPMLYVCLSDSAERYYADAAESTRCAPLEAVGLDGRSPAPAQACETVRDRCDEVPDAERCAAWAERRRVAEQALTFAPENFDAARAELARVDEALAGTTCAR